MDSQEYTKKKLKIKLWRILERRGVWQSYKHRFIKRKYRDELFKEIMHILPTKQEEHWRGRMIVGLIQVFLQILTIGLIVLL